MTENINRPSTPEPGSSGRVFCVVPSSAYLQLLEDCDEDPRSTAGTRALIEAGPNAERGWQPNWEARQRVEE